MSTISFTIPFEAEVLTETAQYLSTLAENMTPSQLQPTVDDTLEKPNEGNLTAFDSTGQYRIPWDERIHSSSKALTATGGWRRRNRVANTLFEQVESELIAAAAVSPPPFVVPDIPAAVESSHIDGQTVPAPPPPPPLNLIPPPSAENTDPPLMVLVRKIAEAKIPPNVVTIACSQEGLTSLNDLAINPDKIPAVSARLFPNG